MSTQGILARIPIWVGFLALILVGAAFVINGIANTGLDPVNQAGFLVFGVMALLVGGISWLAGGTSQVKGRVGTVGARVAIGDLPTWVWVVDIAIIVVAVVVFVILAYA